MTSSRIRRLQQPSAQHNRFNEDWYSVTLRDEAFGLSADAKYDILTTGATVAVEIRNAAGALVANGTLVPQTGAVHAVTGVVPAGIYRVGVSHLGGGTVPSYALQVYAPLTMDTRPVRDWTVGRPYESVVCNETSSAFAV